MRTFAIDPGPHTGIFYNSDRLGEFRFNSLTLDYTDKELTPMPHRGLYYWLLQTVDPSSDRVVLESFEFRKDDAHNREYIDYSPGELVGVVKLFCQLTGTPLFMQTASLAKGGFWKDDAKVKKVGIKWKTKHERDAAKHWLYHRTFTMDDKQWLMKLK